ncbi:hypothetical protein LTS12_008888 [Elasticomyces elasticus]|nr:hypothetical protein LTS12_008888 [Elasticomyces elasticus]
MTLDAGLNKTTSTDHRGWLWVTTILSIIYNVSVLVARLFGKYGLLWYDDATMGLAYCIAIARWGILMQAAEHGLGADLAAANLPMNTHNIALVRPVESMANGMDAPLTILQHAFTSRVLLIICLYLAKLSIVLFSHRIFSGNLSHERIIFVTVYAIIGVGGIASMVAVSIDCHPSHYLLGQDGVACSSNTARSVVVCILDTLSEIAIVAVPVLLLSKLQMQETKKRMVYTVFAARIGVVVFGISQAVAYNHFLKHHNRASIGLLPTLSLQELWLMYSFISATIPCMRSFLGAFGSPRLAVISPGNTKQSGYGSQGTALSTLKRRFSGEKGREASARVSSKANFRPDGPFYGVDIRHEEREGAGDDNSLASDGSEQMIIRRDTQIHIEREAISVDGNDDTGHHVGHAR